jgi:GT2 family glycosyltransferase
MTDQQFLTVIPTISGSLEELSRISDVFTKAGGSPIFIANSARAATALSKLNAPFQSFHSNDGFGVSINRTVKQFDDWDWLVISNDDIEVDVARLKETLASIGDGPRNDDLFYLVEERPRPIPGRWEVFLQCSMLNRIRLLGFPAREGDSYQSFSCVAISRRLWCAAGGFDENQPFTYEDADFVRRALSAGFTTIAATETGVTHMHSVSTGAYIDRVLPVATTSALAYLNKWHPQSGINRLTILSGLFFRILLVPLARSSKVQHLRGIRRAMVSVLASPRHTSSKPLLPDYWEI